MNCIWIFRTQISTFVVYCNLV